MAPLWLTTVAWISLVGCFCCAAIITYDIVVHRRHQSMGVMNLVYPITALYFGPFALALYWLWGRAPSPSMPAISNPATPHGTDTAADDLRGLCDNDRAFFRMEAAGGPHAVDAQGSRGEREKPRWVTLAIEVSHCGSGCSLGDVISEFSIFALGLSIAGRTLGVEYIGDFSFALILGVVFQYFAIAPMRGLGLKDGLMAAAKADVISLSAFEIGLFGWMALMALLFFPAPHHLMPNSVAYWLLMQIGMIIGFLTAWPANVWLIKRGIKTPM